MNDIAKAGVKFPPTQHRDGYKNYLRASEAHPVAAHPVPQGSHSPNLALSHTNVPGIPIGNTRTQLSSDNFEKTLRYFISETGLAVVAIVSREKDRCHFFHHPRRSRPAGEQGRTRRVCVLAFPRSSGAQSLEEKMQIIAPFVKQISK